MELIAGEKVKGETSRAIAACNDWLRMGRGRSYAELAKTYKNLQKPTKPPTKKEQTIREWATKYNWKERAALYDDTWEKRANAERERVFEHALANDFGRVEALLELAETLRGELYEKNKNGVLYNIWQPDPKRVGDEVYDLEKFNGQLIREYRATLDDIAKEVGGRIHKQEVSNVSVDYSTLSDEQLERLADGEDLTSVLTGKR